MSAMNVRELADEIGVTPADIEAVIEFLRAADAALIDKVVTGKITLAAALRAVEQKYQKRRMK